MHRRRCLYCDREGIFCVAPEADDAEIHGFACASCLRQRYAVHVVLGTDGLPLFAPVMGEGQKLPNPDRAGQVRRKKNTARRMGRRRGSHGKSRVCAGDKEYDYKPNGRARAGGYRPPGWWRLPEYGWRGA